MTCALRQHHDALWTLTHPFRLGLIELGTRTTVIALGSEELLVHSPGPLTADQLEAVSSLGRVTQVVAPNSMHYLYFESTLRHFPEAQGWVSPALGRRLPRLQGYVSLNSAPPFTAQLRPLEVQGLGNLGEFVFHHPASSSLIVTDLVFHMLHSPSAFTRLFMRLNGAYGRFGPTRIFRHLVMKERHRLRQSIQELLDLQFQRVVMAHGEVLEQGGKDALARAFAWL